MKIVIGSECCSDFLLYMRQVALEMLWPRSGHPSKARGQLLREL